MGAGEQEQADGNAEERGKNEPSSAEQVDFFPVLYDDDGGDGDRNQHGERGGDLQRKAEDEQWNRDETFAESEGGADQRGDEHDKKNEGRGEVDWGSPTENCDFNFLMELGKSF